MGWGLVNKEDIETMLNDRRLEDRRKVDADIAACNAKHAAHDKYKEEVKGDMAILNSGLIELTKTLHTTNLTLSKWVELQPTIERTRNNYTTIDTIKSWIGSIAVFYVLYDIIKKIIGI